MEFERWFNKYGAEVAKSEDLFERSSACATWLRVSWCKSCRRASTRCNANHVTALADRTAIASNVSAAQSLP
jgi:hypothetical protein